MAILTIVTMPLLGFKSKVHKSSVSVGELHRPLPRPDIPPAPCTVQLQLASV